MRVSRHTRENVGVVHTTLRARYRVFALVLIDAIIILLSGILGVFIRFEFNLPVRYLQSYLGIAMLEVPLRLVIHGFFGLYNRLWRYASVKELISIVAAVGLGSAFVLGAVHLPPFVGYPRSVVILSFLINVSLIGGSRFGVRLLQELRAIRAERAAGKASGQTRLLIVGAGDAGTMMLREILRSPDEGYEVVGFVDDDRQKTGFRISGVPVLGTTADVQRLVKEHSVDEILIAVPSLDHEGMRALVRRLKKSKVRLKTVPRLVDLVNGQVTIGSIRDVRLQDLLQRDEIKVDLETMSEYLKDHVVLVTGAGGSIGSELCRQICRFAPKQLILFGNGENSIYEADLELREQFPDLDLVPVIADVRDRDRIFRIFERYKPEVVFHAAAHKHVPLMESNPEEAVSNNVFGTKNVAEAADKVGTKRFVMISTDKAVNPTSIMGASKRLAEIVVQMIGRESSTKFVSVRFGNVLGSRGSVVPLFERQIERGGPVTVTHPDMQRYFMTIPEAVQLVIQAGAMGKGGEVFVLDMGKPVKIVDIAEDLIRLHGLEPGVDIQIEFCGMRPGEKLFEELLTAEEGTDATTHERIFVARGKVPFSGSLDEFVQLIAEVSAGRNDNYENITQLVNSLITVRKSAGEPEGSDMVAAATEELTKPLVKPLESAAEV
ncbi:MAG TPA: nucleoside-diphosphate sugar epimerase/dehydratase [Bacillota bacterium]|nr:nucleoside-diphosphate sugar epimerase/dehydratase [Bacillota bacterium]